MSSFSPGVTIDAKLQSTLQFKVLTDSANRSALHLLRQVIDSSVGPSGKLKFCHNASGGHVTVTSSSNRLLQAISASNPLVKLILSAAQGHINSYKDGGLFALSFALSLVENSLELAIHPRLLTDVYDLLLQESLSFLQSDDFPCKLKLKVSGLEEMKTVIRSVLAPKRGCIFQGEDVNHISFILLQAFLRSMPNHGLNKPSSGTLQYLCIEGKGISESYMTDGILFEYPQIPSYRCKPIDVKTEKEGVHAGMMKVALFNVSLTGDTQDNMDTKYEVDGSLDVEESILRQMETFMDGLVHMDVGVVACQRVIHPSIKGRLRRSGVFVLDRLGNRYIYALHSLIGGQVLGSFVSPLRESDCGWLQSLKHLVVADRSYVHLQNPESPVCTLVLANRTEESLNELKHVCQSAEATLRRTLLDPRGLAGAGCWQTLLAAALTLKVKEYETEWSEDLGCTPQQLTVATNTFTKSLKQVVRAIGGHMTSDHMTDSANHHHWIISPHDFSSNTTSDRPDNSQSINSTKFDTKQCCCGMIERDSDTKLSFMNLERTTPTEINVKPVNGSRCSVIDSYQVMVNALRTAVGIAMMVLGIHNIIVDTN